MLPSYYIDGTLANKDIICYKSETVPKYCNEKTINNTSSNTPFGYSVTHTNNGEPILSIVNEPNNNNTDIPEYHEKKIKICSSVNNIEKSYGKNIATYFKFGRMIIIANLIFFGIALINFIPSVLYTDQCTYRNLSIIFDETMTNTKIIRDSLTSQPSNCSLYEFASIFTIQSYDPKIKDIWIVTTSIMVVLSILFAPFVHYAQRFFATIKQNCLCKKEPTTMELVQPRQLSIHEEMIQTLKKRDDIMPIVIAKLDMMTQNNYITSKKRLIRVVTSYVLMFFILAGSGVATYYVTNYCKLFSKYFKLNSFATPIILSTSNIAIQYSWKAMCILLTKFEKHETHTKYKKHIFSKIFIFKFLNIIVFYVAQYFVDAISTTQTDCPLFGVGAQFLVNYLCDVGMFYITGIIWPILYYYILICKGLKSKQKVDVSKYTFDIVEEYIDMIYRQFVLYLAGIIIPMIYVLGFVVGIIEYYFINRIRIIYVYHVVPSNSNISWLIVFALFIVGTLSIFVFPNGILWIILKMPNSRFTNCNFFK